MLTVKISYEYPHHLDGWQRFTYDCLIGIGLTAWSCGALALLARVVS